MSEQDFGWFFDWLDVFIRANPRHDWPALSDEAGEVDPFFVTWLETFRREGIREVDAKEATRRVAGQSPRFLTDVRSQAIEAARAAKLRRSAGYRAERPFDDPISKLDEVRAAAEAGDAGARAVLPFMERAAEKVRGTTLKVVR